MLEASGAGSVLRISGPMPPIVLSPLSTHGPSFDGLLDSRSRPCRRAARPPDSGARRVSGRPLPRCRDAARCHVVACVHPHAAAGTRRFGSRPRPRAAGRPTAAPKTNRVATACCCPPPIHSVADCFRRGNAPAPLAPVGCPPCCKSRKRAGAVVGLPPPLTADARRAGLHAKRPVSRNRRRGARVGGCYVGSYGV